MNFIASCKNQLAKIKNQLLKQLFFERWKKKKTQVANIEGIKLLINENMPERILEYIYLGYYEKCELQIVKKQIDKNDIVLELGTGLGLISSYCAKKIGSERVFTYEANPALEKEIRQNYKLNNVAPNLEICLLGEQTGEATFYVNKSFWASSMVQRNQDDIAVQVPVKSLNEEIRRINPSFLILDIEGGEYELFKYADFYNIRKLAIELHQGILGKEKTQFVRNKLAELGFQFNPKFSYTQELFFEREL